MSLVVTGTVGIDTIVTPKSHAEGVLGGSCAYFAAAASFFGGVRMVAAVGEDFPEAHRKTLLSFKGIDSAGLETRRGGKTFSWGGKYLPGMNSRESMFTELGVVGEKPPEVPAAYRDSKFVFLANMPPAVQGAMLDQFPSRKLAVADTMDLWIANANTDLRALLRRVDGLVLNYDEAEQLTEKANVVSAARHILDMGPRFVVVKKGEHGCILVHRDGIAALPAYPSETVVDPTGAGDTFAGGMMGSIASIPAGGNGGNDPGSFDSVRKALGYGTVIASFTIESFSLGRLQQISRTDVDRRYAEFSSMTRIG